MRLIPLAVAFTVLPLISPCSVKVDFTADGGRLERALHSSGFAPALSPRPRPGTDEAELKPFGFFAARTHDWALVNAGQRVVDTHFIFPLMHLDARDPKNYVFGPTDEALRLARDMGLKIFYRLGSSIEHTEDGHHWNIVVSDGKGRPADFAVNSAEFVDCPYDANPGTADRTWKGPSDCSFSAWVGRDATNRMLRLRVEVEDDVHSQPAREAKGDEAETYNLGSGFCVRMGGLLRRDGRAAAAD